MHSSPLYTVVGPVNLHGTHLPAVHCSRQKELLEAKKEFIVPGTQTQQERKCKPLYLHPTAVYIPERVFLSTSQKLNQINQVLGIRAVCVASVEVGEEDLRKGKHAEHQHAVGRYLANT